MIRLLLASTTAFTISACATVPEVLSFEIHSIPASTETDPMTGIGDRADDPAIWVSDSDDQPTLILGTNKEDGLHVYDLSGRELQFLNIGMVNNVDLRGRYAVASNDENEALSWFNITHSVDQPVIHIGDTPVKKTEPYGVCLGHDADGLIAATTYKDGLVQLWRASVDKDKPINTVLERTVQLPSKLEGCVFDETQELLFIGEEAFGIWSLAYRDASSEAQIVDRIEDSNGLVEDTEGLSIWWAQNGGYLIASAQEADRYVVYDRLPPHAPRGVFSIAASADGTVDGVTHTDGLDVVSSALPGYPSGLLVVQDDANPDSEVDQNFKLVDWRAVMAALGLE